MEIPVFITLAIAILNVKVQCQDEGMPSKGCGWRNPDGLSSQLIHDEDISNFGEFPWMVALLEIIKLDVNHSPMLIYQGGGSLIHPSVVLTAAHVVAKMEPANLRARAGEWNAQTTQETYPHQDRSVNKVITHEKYNKDNVTYNIALLFLTKPMNLAPNVGLACLPPAEQTAQPGTKCFSLGWGKNKMDSTYSIFLKKVEMPVVSREECQDKYRKKIGDWFQLHSTYMCAGEKGKYSCKGDGGSPLLCPMEEKNRYVQNGIAAWSTGCVGDPPGAYVDVAKLRVWVDEKVKENGLQTSTYSDYKVYSSPTNKPRNRTVVVSLLTIVYTETD